MKRKTATKIGSIILDYLTRNAKYDQIPKDFYSRGKVLEITGFSHRKFQTFLRKGMAMNMVERKWFRGGKNGRVLWMPYYKFHSSLLKLMGLTSR